MCISLLSRLSAPPCADFQARGKRMSVVRTIHLTTYSVLLTMASEVLGVKRMEIGGYSLLRL